MPWLLPEPGGGQGASRWRQGVGRGEESERSWEPAGIGAWVGATGQRYDQRSELGDGGGSVWQGLDWDSRN